MDAISILGNPYVKIRLIFHPVPQVHFIYTFANTTHRKLTIVDIRPSFPALNDLHTVVTAAGIG